MRQVTNKQIATITSWINNVSVGSADVPPNIPFTIFKRDRNLNVLVEFTAPTMWGDCEVWEISNYKLNDSPYCLNSYEIQFILNLNL